MFVRILFVLLITKIFPLFSCELTNGFYKYKDSNYIATPPSSINHEDYDVILIGETHSNQLHHHFQSFLLSNFITEGNKYSLALEMIEKNKKLFIDQWMQNLISDQDFKEKIEWDTFWGFQWDDYLTILNIAKFNSVNINGINTSQNIINFISEYGLNEAVQKKIINETPFAINEDYRNRLLSYFDQHKSLSNFDKQKFEFFLESQTYWDYIFAKNIVDLFNNDTKVISISGTGHIEYENGISWQINKINPNIKVLTIALVNSINNCENEKISDYIFVGSNYKESNTIGITIIDSEEGVKVTDVKNKSIAFDIDIKPGDTILNIGGRKVNNSFDVSFLLNIYDKPIWIPVEIKRNSSNLIKIIKFK